MSVLKLLIIFKLFITIVLFPSGCFSQVTNVITASIDSTGLNPAPPHGVLVVQGPITTPNCTAIYSPFDPLYPGDYTKCAGGLWISGTGTPLAPPQMTTMVFGKPPGYGSYIADGLAIFGPVTLNRGTITSAILTLTSGVSDSYNDADTVNIRIYAYNTDNADWPHTRVEADFILAVLSTSAYTSVNSFEHCGTRGSQHNIDITAPVQEILLRPGWVNGNRILLLFANNGSTANTARYFTSGGESVYSGGPVVIDCVPEKPTGCAPVLTITY